MGGGVARLPLVPLVRETLSPPAKSERGLDTKPGASWTRFICGGCALQVMQSFTTFLLRSLFFRNVSCRGGGEGDATALGGVFHDAVVVGLRAYLDTFGTLESTDYPVPPTDWLVDL